MDTVNFVAASGSENLHWVHMTTGVAAKKNELTTNNSTDQGTCSRNPRYQIQDLLLNQVLRRLVGLCRQAKFVGNGRRAIDRCGGIVQTNRTHAGCLHNVFPSLFAVASVNDRVSG